ncbi:MAG: hypothetical protein J6Q25_07670 [Bacteroidales bacterium]|nr:hypothetical protein [Bacteroidales bacterium]
MEKILQHIEALQERLQSLSEEMALVRLQLDDLKLLCQAAFEPSLETPEVSQEDAMIIGAELAATALLIDDESSEEDDLEESVTESLEVAEAESLEESETESLEVLANEVPDSYEDAPVFTDDGADDAPDFDADEISDDADEISNVEEEEAVDEMLSENPVMDEAVEAEASDGEPEADPEVEADFEIESEAEAENETEANFKTEDDGEPASETLAESLAQERPDSLAERYEKQLAQKRLQNTLAAQRYADFSRALSLNDRFRYQRELFNNNREALSQLLAALDSMETWAEAEDYLSSYQWDEELPVVQEFYAMIEQHFNQ